MTKSSHSDNGLDDTAPAQEPVATAETAAAPQSTPVPAERSAQSTGYPSPEGGKLGSAWVGLVVGALITIVLLIFVLQNLEKVTTRFLAWQFDMPLGVLMLFVAIAGALIMAMFAGFRILQLRMRARRAQKLRTSR